MEKKQIRYCKQVFYIDENKQPHTLLGLILSEDEYFIVFKTRQREISISKRYIVSIITTDIEFNGGDEK